MFIIIKTGGVSDVEVLTKIEVCVKYRSDKQYYYGIVITENGRVVKNPVYPFADKESLNNLEQFVSLFKEDLLNYYSSCNGTDFGHYLYSFNTERKENFRNYWFEKGVLIY